MKYFLSSNYKKRNWVKLKIYHLGADNLPRQAIICCPRAAIYWLPWALLGLDQEAGLCNKSLNWDN